MQLQNYVMDVQTKLNHEKKEREVDQAALTTRYLILFCIFSVVRSNTLYIRIRLSLHKV